MMAPLFACLLALLASPLLHPAAAGEYRLPTTDEHEPYFYPTAYYDHSGVDWNCGSITYSGHNGNDFGVGSWDGMDAGRDLVAAWEGTVYAIHDGEYDRCSTGDCEGGGGYGNYVMVEHPNGQLTIYAHMRQWTVAVETGDAVECGTYLGQVGSSGYSTGPHLHFEVRESSGDRSDPFDGDCSYPPSYWVHQGVYEGLPSLDCYESGTCVPVDSLTCGDTVDSSNAASGSTDVQYYYGCSDFTYSGPEVAWELATSLTETVSIRLSNVSDDLDLYVLGSDACDGSDCITASTESDTSDESVEFDATADQTYVVVVDGWEQAESSFHLEVDCDGSWPGTTDTGDPDDPDDPDDPVDSGDSHGPDDTGPGGSAGDSGTASGGALPPPGVRTPMDDEAGCGCGTSRKAASLAGILPALFLFAGRRRRSGGSRRS